MHILSNSAKFSAGLPLITEGLTVLATCTADIRQWYLRNGLQLKPDKSEALIIGTTNQLQVATASLSSVTVAGVECRWPTR